MMKFSSVLVLFFSLLLLISTTQASTVTTPTTKETTKKKSNKGPISSEIGLNIPEWGISIDAIFNPELDDLIPGYHILNIVLTNRRAEGIDLNPTADRWIITGQDGRRHTASNHVSYFDKKLWEQLPPKLQKLLDYPPSVSAGKSVKIDVFVSKSIPLHNFKELAWRSEFFNKTFNVFTTYEDKIITPNDKEFNVQKGVTSLEPEFDINNLPEDLPEDDGSASTPSKFDLQDQTTIEQPQEQTIVIH